ncbi:MAG TPA: histidine kinase dimerization/phospho-acceptor domain-containing protein, partial [Solirubrobacteraceae bacterium]|nr:histidine kinase dimerization/phospho-acceptor domain-containing protein [Solirubrobacteraceae bacterium]
MSLRRPWSLRRRLLLAVVLAVAVALGALLVAFNVILDARLNADATAVLRTRTSGQLATLATVNGKLRMTEAPDVAAFDRPTWVFDARGRALEHPLAAPAVDRAAAGLARGPRRAAEVSRPHTRLLAVPVIKGARRLGTVVAGVSLQPYDRTKRTVLLASLLLGIGLLITVALATRRVLAAALRPVARMTADAAEWSERDLDRRFNLGAPRDELTQLAKTLDALLDRRADDMRREQRFTAELSHELRTPLARIAAEAQLALRAPRDGDEYREALTAILRSSEQMKRALEALMSAARLEVGARGGSIDAGAAADAAVEANSQLAEQRGVDVAVKRPATSLRVGVDGDMVERILQPLIENACRYGRTRV